MYDTIWSRERHIVPKSSLEQLAHRDLRLYHKFPWFLSQNVTNICRNTSYGAIIGIGTKLSEEYAI